MGNIITGIKNKIDMFNFNKEREEVIKRWICNIGEFVEEEDRIICYVKQDLLVNKCRYICDYLLLDGLFAGDKFYIEQRNRLNLNKPVFYIFDGIHFEWCFRFNSKGNCHIIFRNCMFKNGIDISYSNNVTFENNKYYDYYNASYLRDNIYLTCNNIANLTFINEHFVNMAMGMASYKFGININADIIKIIDSHIDCGKFGDINVRSNKMVVKNSNIDVRQLNINAKKLIYFNSNINAKKSVVIDNENRDFVGYISSPIVTYNGIMTKPINSFLKDVSEMELINRARIDLILKLYQISNSCQRIEDRKIKNVRRVYEQEPIGLVAMNDDISSKYKDELLRQSRIELIKKLSEIRDYYQLVSEEKINNVKHNFENLSISRVLKRDDLGY